jgi:hypothetical protein
VFPHALCGAPNLLDLLIQIGNVVFVGRRQHALVGQVLKHPQRFLVLGNCARPPFSQAQQANEWDMDGHAQRAKETLDQVGRELKEAALAANRNHK